MKKLVFLLLMAVAIACVVPAWDAAHPPGDFAPEIVLVSAVPAMAELPSIQAATEQNNYNETAIQFINTGQFRPVAAVEEANHCLRC